MKQYNGSDQHIRNTLAAREKALLVSADKFKQRMKTYAKDPSLCTYCKSPLDYRKRHNKFCGSSCSAIFNNTSRVVSEETKQKVKHTLQVKYETGILVNNSNYKNCKFCDTKFKSPKSNKRRFCTTECKDSYKKIASI